MRARPEVEERQRAPVLLDSEKTVALRVRANAAPGEVYTRGRGTRGRRRAADPERQVQRRGSWL